MKMLILLLISFVTYAEVVCVNPTTQFYLRKGRVGHDLTLSSPHGAQFTPIYDGQVPPIALSQFEEEAKVISSLGKLLKITFPEGACAQEGSLVSCDSGVMDNPRVGKIRFYSTQMKEVSFQATYTLVRLNLVMIVDGRQYRVSSRYALDTCSFK